MMVNVHLRERDFDSGCVYLELNPADQVSPLKVPDVSFDFYDTKESGKFLDAAKKYELAPRPSGWMRSM